MLPPALTHLALLALVSVAGAVEQGELCQIEMNNIKGKLQANCTWLALSTVPSQLPKDTGILLLGSNHLASVSTSSFQYLPMLVDLDLSHNGLKSFHAGPPLLQLQELILSHNALGALPPLQGLPALLCLGLAHNSIKDLPLGAFRSLGNLKELDLKGNRLQRLPKDAFAGLAALQDLDLSNNALEELPLGLLTELESLDTLRLPGNRLRTVPTDFFPKNHSFPYVFLDKNPWHCDCSLAYLRDWITENDGSIYYQEEGLDKTMVENDAESVKCDSPARYKGTPVIHFMQVCSKGGDRDTSGHEPGPTDFPMSPISVPFATMASTSPLPPTGTPVPLTSTLVPPTSTTVPLTGTHEAPASTSIPLTSTPVPPTSTLVPSNSTPVPPTTTTEHHTLVSPSSAPSITMASTSSSPPAPSTPGTSTISTIISSLSTHVPPITFKPTPSSPLPHVPHHQPSPSPRPPPVCSCLTSPAKLLSVGHHLGGKGHSWGHWVLAHCCLLHLVLYLASLVLLVLPTLVLLGWLAWLCLVWKQPTPRASQWMQRVHYQLLEQESWDASPVMHLRSLRNPPHFCVTKELQILYDHPAPTFCTTKELQVCRRLLTPIFCTTKELQVRNYDSVPAFQCITKQLPSGGREGPGRSPSAYSLDRGVEAIGAVRVKYATNTL
ncbi:PREDICTED: platelet glycoprotein Ib alpha chain-like [Crocodylus porosus]|uniref:platelet glycoprotein Ib alpha chain-like n=1 Tax=Crocodylus porosus TaxID=8502 RepID=UPI00093A3EC8|nr:PREDICTED: platelet glycoprotein Ib alpha chain-like [Crocodylus porosus]